jgi:hypothetical protein
MVLGLTGDFQRTGGWVLSINSAGHAALTPAAARRVIKEFRLSPQQMERLRVVLTEERFLELQDNYGHILPDGHGLYISVVAGDRWKTVRISLSVGRLEDRPQLAEAARGLRLARYLSGLLKIENGVGVVDISAEIDRLIRLAEQIK